MLMGLDVGDKRVGTALVDGTGKKALPFKTLLRAKYQAEQGIMALIQEHQVSTLVVGIPLHTDGQISAQGIKIQNFCRRLLKRIKVEVVYMDETLSSEEAIQKLNLNFSKARKKAMTARRGGAIDSASAAIILQRYLDSVK